MEMEKSELVEFLKQHRKEVQGLIKETSSITGSQVQAGATLSKLEALATKWFDSVEPEISLIGEPAEEAIGEFRNLFGQILKLTEGRPSKKGILELLSEIEGNYHADLVVLVQTTLLRMQGNPKLEKMLLNVEPEEKEYLEEAIDCANTAKRRAAVILGWCAAVNRMHLVVEKKGFLKFNQASSQMHAITTGRFKRFNKIFDVHSISELRMTVFDNDLLWILEYLQIIDGNEHERLNVCLVMRDTSAHPGDAIVTEENLESFFSDLDTMVFSNPKFKISHSP